MTNKAMSMIEAQDKRLRMEIRDRHYPNVTPITAKHVMYGYLLALRDIGLIDDKECFVPSNCYIEYDTIE